MQNFNQPGEVLALTAPYLRTAGQGAKVGAIFGVATSDVASGASGQFMVEGVFTLASTSAQAWTQGQRIYWDDTNHRCDNDPTVGMLIGVARDAKANPSSTGVVKLNGACSEFVQGQQPTIAAVSTAAATDLATSEALANQLKTSLNLVIAALKAAGILA